MNKGQFIESIIAVLSIIPVLPVLVLFSMFGFITGLLMAFNPALPIEIQRRFYYHINWKIEPVSMSKEIRNTRAMGWFLIVLSITTLLFAAMKAFR